VTPGFGKVLSVAVALLAKTEIPSEFLELIFLSLVTIKNPHSPLYKGNYVASITNLHE
jgi:hypothetical protein